MDYEWKTLHYSDIPPVAITKGLCPPGFHSNLNRTSCIGCTPNTFSQFYDNETSCQPCPSGGITSGYYGATSCIDCKSILGVNYCEYLTDPGTIYVACIIVLGFFNYYVSYSKLQF